jgi:hypothetical protein
LPTLWYEILPPRIIGFSPLDLERSLTLLYERAASLREVVDRILITSSVLGVPRLPSVSTAAQVKGKIPDLWVGCSIRTGDFLLHQAFKMSIEAFTSGLDGVLLVYGDKPQYGSSYKNYPSPLLKIIRQFIRVSNAPRIYLSAPTYRKDKEVERKIESHPDGLITQMLTEAEQIFWLKDICKSNSIELVATILVPSAKNLSSAKKTGLRWQPDESHTIQQIKALFKEGVNVSLTSPWSFKDGLEFVKKLRALYK